MALGCVLVLACSFISFYKVTLPPPSAHTATATLLGAPYGGWRWAVPVSAMVTGAGALFVLHRRRKAVLAALRVGTLVTGVVVLLAAHSNTPPGCGAVCAATTSGLAVGGWLALGGAVVAALSILALGARRLR